jgi:uncharacterized protein YjdB
VNTRLRTASASALLWASALAGCDAWDQLINTAIVESVAVVPDTATLSVEESLQLSARLEDAGGNRLQRQPEWRSLHPAVVRVDAAGNLTGLAIGMGRVQATADGRSGVALVRVVPLVASVTITPSAVTLTEGELFQLGATLRDRHGTPLLEISPTWRSIEPDVATVAAEGRVHAVAAGQARIVAFAGYAADTAEITVELETAVSISPAGRGTP